MIYHYTTTASLDGIIRNDGIYLRATHYQHLNDKHEVAWCQESLRELCEDLKNMPDEDFQLYYNTPYIVSLCTSNDDFNMWRLYGDNGKGVMFSGCTNLEHIIVDNNNKIYDSRDNCNAIIETATNELVASCKNTTIPSTVTSIGYSAFASCTSQEFTSIVIPEGVQIIKSGAFYNCI